MRTFCTLSVALALAACGNQSDTDLTVEETSAAPASVAAEPMTAPSMQVPIAESTEPVSDIKDIKKSDLRGRWQMNLADCKEESYEYVLIDDTSLNMPDWNCELPQKLTNKMRLQCDNTGDAVQSNIQLDKLHQNIIIVDDKAYKKCPAGSEKYLP